MEAPEVHPVTVLTPRDPEAIYSGPPAEPELVPAVVPAPAPTVADSRADDVLRAVAAAVTTLSEAAAKMQTAVQPTIPAAATDAPLVTVQPPLAAGVDSTEWKASVGSMLVSLVVGVVAVVNPGHSFTSEQKTLLTTIATGLIGAVALWYTHRRTKLKLAQIAQTGVYQKVVQP